MRILALETSTPQIGVAVLDGHQLLASKISEANQKTAAVITPLIAQVLAETSLNPREIDAVSLSIGPGSFTGLRIGCVTAKVWSFALDRPIIAVETHEAIATQACHFGAGTERKIWVCTDAQRHQLFVSSWKFDPASVSYVSLDKVSIRDPVELVELVEADDLISGEGLKKLAPDLAAQILAPRTSPEVWRAKAAVIGEIAIRKFTAGEFVDAMIVKPLYIRPSAAEEKVSRG